MGLSCGTVLHDNSLSLNLLGGAAENLICFDSDESVLIPGR